MVLYYLSDLDFCRLNIADSCQLHKGLSFLVTVPGCGMAIAESQSDSQLNEQNGKEEKRDFINQSEGSM